jgi:hypothetical protein
MSRARFVPVVLAVLLALLWAVEFLWAHHHAPVFPWHSVPGYMAVIGFGGCVLLTLVALAGKKLLQRPAAPEHRPGEGANDSGDPHDRA